MRFSLGPTSTQEEVDQVTQWVEEIIAHVRNLTPPARPLTAEPRGQVGGIRGDFPMTRTLTQDLHLRRSRKADWGHRLCYD